MSEYTEARPNRKAFHHVSREGFTTLSAASMAWYVALKFDKLPEAERADAYRQFVREILAGMSARKIKMVAL